MPDARKSILIVSPEVAGVATPLQIGSILDALALQYRNAGWNVTLLLASRQNVDPIKTEAQRKTSSAVGIEFVECATRQKLSVPYPLQFSWNVWRWMAGRRFDLAVFCDTGGLGAYPMLAKRTGLDFARTRMVVSLQGPTLWQRDVAKEYVEGLEDICADAAERLSVRLADAVVSPSQYMFGYVETAGWHLPDERYHLANPLLLPVDLANRDTSTESTREIAFLQNPTRSAGLTYVLAGC